MSRRSRLDHVGVGREPRRLRQTKRKMRKRTMGSLSREPMRSARVGAPARKRKMLEPGRRAQARAESYVGARSEGDAESREPRQDPSRDPARINGERACEAVVEGLRSSRDYRRCE
jgi:hypothetical protein